MEKQQKQKLAVALIFFSIITGISVWAYFAILKPNKEYHKRTGKKYTQKKEYKTDYNPDYIDSLVEVNKNATKK
jgi:hypothetical protein